MSRFDPKKSAHSLLFRGQVHVHGLYDYLLKWTEPRSDKRALSFPQLYSGMPFLNASLKSAKIHRSSNVKQGLGDSYKLIIKGVILPHSWQKLLDLLQQQNEEFTINSFILDHRRGLQEALDQKYCKTIECTSGTYYLKE